MRLELSDRVEGDIEAIVEYIAEDSPLRAIAFLAQMRERMIEVAKWPSLYQLRPEIGGSAHGSS